MYRSPSTSPKAFIDSIKTKVAKLNKHKNKHILLLGDTNIDLIKYDDDVAAHDLIDATASYGFAPIISRPTRITDHRTTLIDHIYTNMIYEINKSGIVTLDISDHLGTYTTLKLSNKLNSSDNYSCTKRQKTKEKYRQIKKI